MSREGPTGAGGLISSDQGQDGVGPPVHVQLST
eukprot:SAG31_NODE_1696_length_7503_cov_45.737574_2_plen_33_part_00